MSIITPDEALRALKELLSAGKITDREFLMRHPQSTSIQAHMSYLERIHRHNAGGPNAEMAQWIVDLHRERVLGESVETGAVSDGSTAEYYELPPGASELQDLISHRNMNAQIGEIFRASYRYGQTSHSDELRDARKIRFYIEAEIARLTA
jgi:hypothetical protein